MWSVQKMNVGVLPVTGFPHEGGKEKQGLHATNNSDTEQTLASHIPHMHSVHGRRLGVIPLKRAFSKRIGSEGK